MEVPRKRMAEEGMRSILSQFEIPDEKSIQASLDQLGQDICEIKKNTDKKKPKVTLSDLNAKLDILLQYIGAGGNEVQN